MKRRHATALAAAFALSFLWGTGGAQAGDRPPPPIDWKACPDSDVAECGNLDVPLDWSDPGGETIMLAVARRPADNPGERVGTLFYNPGGPGDGGVRYVVAADQIFSETLRERFDIVAMDPRGVAGSTPVRCSVPVLTPDFWLWPRTEQEFDALVARSRAVGENCLEETGPLLGHLDTVSVARDHEALRRALDVPEISWLGISYGTQVAANHAELFPDSVRAMSLDAALEHSLPEVVQVADEMRAQEDGFNRFVAWCATTDACALHGQDVASRFDRLVASADAAPIHVDGAVRPVRGEDIRMGTINLLTFKEPSIYGTDASWAGLSRVLAAAFAGDFSAFALPQVVPQTDFWVRAGIGCMDYDPQVRTWQQMRERLTLGEQTAPHLGGASEVWWALACTGWPLEPANPPRTLDVDGVPALIVHATFDPSVPYKWAHSLAAQIEGSRVLTRAGDGHTSYYTSPCAQEAVDAFLVGLTYPDRLVCD
jgi:pimeloyl-ACP methyl ester carboxylesterase